MNKQPAVYKMADLQKGFPKITIFQILVQKCSNKIKRGKKKKKPQSYTSVYENVSSF